MDSDSWWDLSIHTVILILYKMRRGAEIYSEQAIISVSV